jgi:hypothetical protein
VAGAGPAGAQDSLSGLTRTGAAQATPSQWQAAAVAARAAAAAGGAAAAAAASESAAAAAAAAAAGGGGVRRSGRPTCRLLRVLRCRIPCAIFHHVPCTG